MRTQIRITNAASTLVALVLLTSCASTTPQHGGAPGQTPAAAKVKAGPTAAATPPAAVQNALLPPLRVSLPAAATSEPRFDVRVHDAPASQFFMSLVAGTPYNMMVNPDVKGNISLSLKDVTIEEVLNATRDVYGYEYRKTPEGFEVLPSQLRTRIFQVNYLDITRRGKSETQVSSGQITQNPNSYQGGSSINGPTTIANGGNASSLASSRIETDTDSNVWKDLSNALRAIVGNKDGRSVVISPDTGVVVVRAMPQELRQVQDFLETVQGSLHRQVILEAKILEVELDHGFQSGINWAALGQVGANKSLLFGQTGGGTLLNGTGTSNIAGNTGVLDPNALNQVANTAVSAFGGAFSLAANLHDFNAFIELLKTQGTVHVLSSPRVATVNNQQAIIKVGTDEFFVTNVSSTTVTGTTTTTTPNITLTPFFSGIALDVTPQIDSHGNVTLHIHPTVSNVQDQTKTITVGGQQQTLPLALSTVRESDSVIYAHSGQVVVIGGLMQTTHNQNVAGTPLLSDIPGIGYLFRNNKTSSVKSELVILLRPVVVTGNDTWRQALEESQQRIGALDRGNQDTATRLITNLNGGTLSGP
ncbi:MAG: pilus (MSHA type) biogenesis protein MshL [Gammaproteobacteria bacterium]